MSSSRRKGVTECLTCNKPFSVDDFYRNKQNSSWSSNCKECLAVITRARRYKVAVEVMKGLLANDTCEICETYLDVKDRFIDHNHKTGEIRGVLCNHCNTGIGMFKDNEDLMLRAIEYIKHK